jgi:phytoene desaturase
MNDTTKAAIIGAGVGGVTTAIYLAKKGFDVTVFEKNASPGGRCGQILRDGHRFDLGATIFLMPSIYRHVFETLGLNVEDCLDTKPLNNLYKIHFEDGAEIAFTTNKEVMKAQLEAIEPGSFEQSQKYVRKGYGFFRASLNELLNRNFFKALDFFNLKNVLLLIKLKTYLKHHTYVSRFFKHAHLKMAYTFQNIYIGQSPFSSPAFFSMLPAAELTEGSLFPTGGMYRVVDKLVSEAASVGVKFQYNKPVSKIVLDGKKATGVLFADGSEAPANVVIANADLPYVYRELLPDKGLSEKIDRKKFSCSAIVFHWGTDKAYPQLDHHNVFLSEDYKANLDKIFNEQSMADNPSFYIHAPVHTDPSAAPACRSQTPAGLECPANHSPSLGYSPS